MCDDSEHATTEATEDDAEIDLFAPDSQPDSLHASSLRSLRNASRLQALSSLPSPHSRSPAQHRAAYVLSGEPLRPRMIEGVLSLEECEMVIGAVEEYVKREGGLKVDRHEAFPTTDVQVTDLTSPSSKGQGGTVGEWVERIARERVLSKMAEATGIPSPQLGFQDLFVVCYSAPEDAASTPRAIPSSQDSLAPHRDGCLLSFSLLLSPATSFTGGGTTFFPPSSTTPPLFPPPPSQSSRTDPTEPATFLHSQGSLLIHSARHLHAGARVTSGQRVVLVGFVETEEVLREKKRWKDRRRRG